MRNWIIAVAVTANIGVAGALIVANTDLSGSGVFRAPKHVLNLELMEMEALGKIDNTKKTKGIPITITLLIRDTADIGRICKYANHLRTSFRKTFQQNPVKIKTSNNKIKFNDVQPLLVQTANRTLKRTCVTQVNLTPLQGQTTASKRLKTLPTVSCAK